MTRIIIDNSNTSVTTKYYIEILSSNMDHKHDNDAVSYSTPVITWLSGGAIVTPTKNFFDYKNITESYIVTGKITVESNCTRSGSSSPYTYTSSADTYIETTEAKLIAIAQTGGVVTLTIIRGSGQSHITGMLTNMSTTEHPQEQLESGSPDVFDVTFTIIKGVNS